MRQAPSTMSDACAKGGLSFTGETVVGHPRRWIEVLLSND